MNTPNESGTSSINICDNNQLLTDSFQETFSKTMKDLESKIETLITAKLDEKMEAIGSFNEPVKKQNDTWSKINQTYASKTSESLKPDEHNKEFRQIIRE